MSILFRILHHLRLIIKLFGLKLISSFKSFNPQGAIIICGDPRGGTTWLAEMLIKIPKTAMIWEPLNIVEVKIFAKLGFNLRQYIPKNADWEKARIAFDTLFRKGIFSEYTIQFLRISEYFNAERLVIKFCRANALLPWLVNNFNFKYSPIFLIRHPISVAASQMTHGAWKHEYKGYQFPKGKFLDNVEKHKAFLKTLNTQEEALVAQWCITNLPTLRDINNNKKWITIYYENLLLNTRSELERIENSWGISLPKESYISARVESKTSVDFQLDTNRQIKKWQSHFSKSQIEKMLAVMAYFECEFYNSDIMPTSFQTK